MKNTHVASRSECTRCYYTAQVPMQFMFGRGNEDGYLHNFAHSADLTSRVLLYRSFIRALAKRQM